MPETDFVGFVAANNAKTLMLSGSVVALAIALAGFLAWQGIQTDRRARELLRRQRALAVQNTALRELAGLDGLGNPADAPALRRATEIMAGATGARGISLWRIEDRLLVCADSFDRDSRGHTDAAEIPLAQCPQFAESLLAGEILSVADTGSDPLTAELYLIYLQAAGCRSLLSVPVRNEDRVVGCVWIEDAALSAEAEQDAIGFVRIRVGCWLPASPRRRSPKQHRSSRQWLLAMRAAVPACRAVRRGCGTLLSRSSVTACCSTRSRGAGLAMSRSPPCAFPMSPCWFCGWPTT